MYKESLDSELLPISDVIKEYFEWAIRRGIQLDKIEYPVRFQPGYIGSRAKENINPGETIISVPNDCILSVNTVKKSDLYQDLIKIPNLFVPREGFSDEFLLTAYLISQKYLGADSEWYYFIRAQPDDARVLQD